MKTNRLIDNRDEARMLLKGNEIVARSSAGVIWNGIPFETQAIPAGGACVPQKRWQVTSDEQSPSPLDGQSVAPSPRLGRGGRMNS